jgi:hypothetical protein
MKYVAREDAIITNRISGMNFTRRFKNEVAFYTKRLKNEIKRRKLEKKSAKQKQNYTIIKYPLCASLPPHFLLTFSLCPRSLHEDASLVQDKAKAARAHETGQQIP